jgi:adenylate cyclase
MASPKPPAVLIVDDEKIAARDLQKALAGLGYDAYAIASSAEQGEAVRDLKRRLDVPVIYLAARAADGMLKRNPAGLKRAMEISAFTSRAVPATAGASAPVTARPGRAAGVRAVRRQVEELFASPDFDAARRSREFLRFVVEETLAGRGEELTQHSIATHVFDRAEDFDATVDPIVRIQAGRLRRSLERYYMLSGSHDAISIELPRGTYIPRFRARAVPDAADADERAPAPAAAPRFSDDWPAVVISAFEADGTSEAEAARCVTDALLLEIGRYRGVRALLQSEPQPHRSAPGTRFVLGGRVRGDAGGLRITTHLVDRATGEQVWGDEYHTMPEADGWTLALEDIGRVIAARAGSEEGVLVQILAAEHRKRRPATVTPFGAVVLSSDFFLTREPQSLAPALQALREVVRVDPDCAAGWNWLARVYLTNYAFEVTAISTPIDAAVAFAQRGVRLEPTSRRARCTLAAALVVAGELGAARAELDDALRMSPDSLAWLETIGCLLTVAGDWTRGPNIIRTARLRNPYFLTDAVGGLWCDHLRRGEFELAYQHALELRDPTFFWRAVMRASCLGHLGRRAESAVEVARLLRDKPDFEARGRTLIGHYIKHPEVMDRVVDGLARAGLTLN